MEKKREKSSYFYENILRGKRLLLMLLMVSIIHVNSWASPQPSTYELNMSHCSLIEIFNSIKDQSDFTFLYSNEDVEMIDNVSISTKGADIKTILDESLKDTNLEYKIKDKVIIIKPSSNRKLKPNIKSEQKQNKKKITGIIKDDQNLPLPGVSVVIKGTNTGVSTDFDGKYSIEVPTNGTVLLFSFIGMIPQEVLITNQTELNVTLKTSSEQLNEITVVVSNGYQKIDRRLFTGAATKIDAGKAKVDGIVDVGRMLEGKVAGVSVQNVSGTFGAAPKIRVRGASSIYGDTKPLWVIDGVVLEDVVDISPDELSSGDVATLISSSVAGINSDDIASFSILKDASATALYGARAMNGVIVITTKKGKAGKTTVNITSEMTIKQKPNYGQYDIMNSQEQMSMFTDMERKGWLTHANMARSQDGGIYFKMYNAINTYNDQTGKFVLDNTPEARANFLKRYEYANTDWFDILFRNSLQQNHSVSISGGSEKSKFYVSTSLLHDEGWTIADQVDRYTINMRGDFDLTDKLSIGIQTKGSIREQETPGSFDRTNDVVNGNYKREFDINPFSYAMNTSRTITPYDENGNLEYFRMNHAPFNIINEYQNNKNELDVLDLNIQADLSYKFNKNLNYKFIGSLRYVKSTNEHKIMGGSNVARAYRANDDATVAEANRYLYTDPENPNANPVVVLPHGGFYNREDNLLKNYYFRNIINWNKTFDEIHIINVLAGQELKYVDRQRTYFNGYGYQYDKGGVVYTDPNIIKSTVQSGYAYFGMTPLRDRSVAAFTNIGYSYKGKYTFNGTARIDGSNKLGEARSARYLPTWNVSGKWDVKSESFLADVDVISYLQLRGTYGLTASMGRSTNSQIILRNELTTTPYESERQNGMLISALENSELTWEKQYETNIGFDIGLLNNRISLQTDMYKRNGFDLIAAIRTSGIGGEAWKYANYADMESKGIEFTLNTKNIKTKDFSWVSNLTFAYNENEITKLESKPNIFDLVKSEGGAILGGPVRGLYSIPFAGLNEDGIPTFKDANGETTTDVYFQDKETDFLKYEGSIDPKITGGLSNQFKYKNWNLNVFMTYQLGNVIRLYPSFHANYSDMDAITRDMNDRWIMKGDEKLTTIPTLVSKRMYDKYGSDLESTYNAYNYSDQRVAKGDFVRMKEISLSYNLPKSVLKKIGLNSAQIKAQGTNLFLLYSDSKLNGQDPEFFGAGGVAMPVAKQYTMTLKLGF